MQDFDAIDLESLAQCTGGAGPSRQQQQEMRQLAQQYCPRIYQRYRNQTITRPIAERCLDEAGYGMFKRSLDRYFGPRR